MNCPNCNKTATVAIGTKHFCTNCGTRVDGSVGPTGHTLDLTQVKPTPVVPAAPTPPPPPVRPVAAPTPAAIVAPATPARLMRDVAVTKTIKPAGELHTRVSPAKTNVLDLREAKPTPPPVVKSEPTPLPMPVQKHVSVHAPKMHTQAKAQAEIPGTKTPEVRLHQIQKRLETAGTVHRSERISRFSQHQAPMAAVAPAVTARAEPSPSPEPVFNPQVAAQHEHLSRLLELSSETEKAPKRIKREPTKANFAAAALAIAVIGGYIWFHNYPHLAISTAADKAGFSASLPNFVPSSYSLNGPVSYAPGLVTLDFTSPSFKDPLKIIQQPTTWDSSSLLDNFVAQKSSNYTTVNGQGLTIYLYNNGQQAAWVNQGIWYTVVGTAHLGRDQLLKMAYSF